MIAVTWYGAAAYCNWLSEQEGLPQDQWCYLPNEKQEYAEGMTIPADVLRRTGYRLPTEAEWEYACRAGAITSRYYGLSLDLLEKYAWYQDNSQDHAWPVRACCPTIWGCSTCWGTCMNGVRSLTQSYQPARVGAATDDINMNALIDIDNPRLLRGGAFTIDRRSSARRTVTGSPRRSGTSTSVSASPGLTTED